MKSVPQLANFFIFQKLLHVAFGFSLKAPNFKANLLTDDYPRICNFMQGADINRLYDSKNFVCPGESCDKVVSTIYKRSVRKSKNKTVGLICIADNTKYNCQFLKDILPRLYLIDALKIVVIFSPQYDSSSQFGSAFLSNCNKLNISLSISDIVKTINHPKLFRWFTSQHQPSLERFWLLSKKIVVMPLGLNPQTSTSMMTAMKLEMENIKVCDRRTFDVFWSMNPTEGREAARRILEKVLGIDIKNDYNSTEFLKDRDNFVPLYLKRLMDSKFVVSPWGVGPDCFRTYEALLAGSIPVVLWSTALSNEIFYELPVIIVKSYTEVSQKFLDRKYIDIFQKIQSNSMDLSVLTPYYWQKRVENAIHTAENASQNLKFIDFARDSADFGTTVVYQEPYF
jgi:hypothetical protein